MEREFDKEIFELVSKPIKNDLNCLISISGHKLLKADIVIFKVINRKWFKRFHTSQISRRFSLINSGINKFVRLDISNHFSDKLLSLIRDKFDSRTGKLEYPSYEQVVLIMNCSFETCKILCKLIRDIISVFEDCTLWIKLGHFARQMRIITAALSRLSVFFKTIVMKICDIYPYLYTYLELLDYERLEEAHLDKDIFNFLSDINVELPKNKGPIKSSSRLKFKSMYKTGEDIGEKVSRNLFNEKIIKNLSKNDNNSKNLANSLILNNSVKSVDLIDKSDNLEIKANKSIGKLDQNSFQTSSFNEKEDLKSKLSMNEIEMKNSLSSNGLKRKKSSKKKSDKDNAINRTEIRMLIKEFKRREYLKRAKRRKMIRRESLKFDIQ